MDLFMATKTCLITVGGSQAELFTNSLHTFGKHLPNVFTLFPDLSAEGDGRPPMWP
jgi:hypothetical protein